MKQVATFSFSEISSAVSLYNAAVRAIGEESIKEITLSMVLDMAKDKMSAPIVNGAETLSFTITMTGDVVVSYELDSKQVVKFLNVFEKYVAPIVSIGKGIYGLISSFKPMVEQFEYDINREFKYPNVKTVVHVSAFEKCFYAEGATGVDLYNISAYSIGHGRKFVENKEAITTRAVEAVTKSFVEGVDKFEVHFMDDGKIQVVPVTK